MTRRSRVKQSETIFLAMERRENDVERCGNSGKPFGSLLGVLLSRVEMEEDPSTAQEERSHDLSRL